MSRSTLLMLAALLGLSACGFAQPATPGHEPPSGGNFNPISRSRSGGD